MAYVRRHWLSSVLYIAIIVLGLAVWLTPMLVSDGTMESVQAQAAEPQPVDPHLYTRVQALRQELSLTHHDLAAMGCTKEKATVLLESFKAWCQTNTATLNQNHQDDLRARAALREAIRRINVGPANARLSNSLSGLQQDLAALYEQRKTTLDGLVARLEATMDAYQLKTWRSARANAGLPAQLRHVPDLTDAQRRAIHDRLSDRSSQDSLSTVLASELTWSQKQALDSSQLNIVVRSPEVRDAEAEVLPVPALLIDQIEPIGG